MCISCHRASSPLILTFVEKAESPINAERHISCRSPTNSPVMESARQKKGGVQRKIKKPPISASDNYYLVHPDLTRGSKKYMWYLARCYDMSNMKRLEQLKYRDILMRQQYLGEVLS